jgi:metal-sulfur cluster biosynthetic enzyme
MTQPTDRYDEMAAAESELEEIVGPEPTPPRAPRDVSGLPRPTPEQVTEAMEDVFDPELGVNVVDLGLLYGVDVDESHDVTLHLTLTSAACPLTDQIEEDTATALDHVPGIRSWAINWVWQPAWTPEKMTQAGRMQMQAMGFNV